MRTAWNKGKKLTQEHKDNLAKNHSHCWLDKHQSEESKLKISQAHTGMKLSDETKEKIRQAHLGLKQSKEQKNKHKEYMTKYSPIRGKHHSEETRQKLSEATTSSILEGKIKRYQGKGGIREDLKEYGYIPCITEANYMRYLKYMNEPFEYQIPILLSNNRWYICDFYLTNKKQFIELKGYEKQIRPKQKEKYELLKKDYPIMNWKMIFQNSKTWKDFVNTYKNIIPNWEYCR